MQTSFNSKIKTIFLLSGKKECRNKVLDKFFSNLGDNVEALQFGFFLKTYASIITGVSEEYITENKNGFINFKSDGVLLRLNDCLNDTATRLGQQPFQYNKMASLFIINQFLGTGYRLEHELPETLTINGYQLLRQIGEVWKLVFDSTIWTALVITAINRSKCDYIVVNDFRFPEEYKGLIDGGIHEAVTIKIMDSTLPVEKPDGYHISEFALEEFPFDYLVNCTIPSYNQIYITAQVRAIIDYVDQAFDGDEEENQEEIL